jgi:5-(carboxyamino)imidazole ribonucleotide synthase
MRIGIIGGGQLGMMMAQEAKLLGHSIISLDPNPNCSITNFSDYHIPKAFNDLTALEEMFRNCDVMTYEFENVDLAVLEKYITKIPQKLKALRFSRERLLEKKLARSLEIKTPAFKEVKTNEDFFFPSVVKTNTGGYDGKGQYKIESLAQRKQLNISINSYICEELIKFDYEISVIASRDMFGNIITYPITKNYHKNGILHLSIANESVNPKLQLLAIDYTKRLLIELDYVGTLAVEYFVKEDEVIFNEFAPRPHNSGHYTIDGCNISQFKNHILAITGEKVVEPVLLNKIVMINVLGQNRSYYEKSKDITGVVVHDYYKNSQRLNRKIGHINIIYQDDTKLPNIIRNITGENKIND